jgi:hypothetical protein
MPDITRPRRRRAIRVAVASLLAALALPAAASAACPAAPTAKAFAQFGDTADYALVPNGHFEAGTSGWSLSGTSVRSENERFKVRAATDARSLAIKPGGEAVSPPICVSVAHPTFRFFARQLDGAYGALFVKLRWQDAGGAAHELMVGGLSSGFTAWQPSQSLLLGDALPLWRADQTVSVRLVFAPMAGGGSWAIDDVMADPYVRG